MQPLHSDGTITVSSTGLDIHYREWRPPAPPAGPALPPVLLLHGLASSCRIYDLCAPRLEGRRVIAYDQRGHGLTGKPDDGYDLATLVADGTGLARSLDLSEPYIVVGHSWGATVALAWAVEQPGAVHAGVLVDGGVSSFRDLPDATWTMVEERFGPRAWKDVTFEALLEHTRHDDLSFLDEDFRHLFFTSLVEANGDGTIRGRLSATRHWQILRAMWEHDLDTAFSELRRPILALMASPASPKHERAWIVDTAREAAQRRQAQQSLLEVRWVENAIHDLPLQHPGLLARAIAEL